MATPSTPSFAREFLAFAHGLSWPALPSSVQEQARLCVIDTLGCALFGSQQPWSQIVAAEIGGDRSKGPCSVFAHDGMTAAAGAALCNGTAAHGFELDDVIDEAILHPGAMVIPAALATAEATGASGERVLLGVVAGYEAAARVGGGDRCRPGAARLAQDGDRRADRRRRGGWRRARAEPRAAQRGGRPGLLGRRRGRRASRPASAAA